MTRSLSRIFEQQVELLGEQLVVVVEVVAEQREGLDERAAPGHDLGAPARQQIERRELLIDPHRIVGADSTVTALDSLMLLVRSAAAASIIGGAEARKSGR